MRIERSITVAAEPEQVVALITDVARWPEWLPTVDAVERLDDGSVAVGSRARVKQPRLPAGTWTVTDLDPARGFAWEARTPGVTTVATHYADRAGTGTTVRLGIEQHGPLAGVLGLVYGRLFASYVEEEAAAVKATCER